MISIDRHIEYLLLEQDCVIVPGLGAFVADRRSARVSGSMVEPPSRSVGFNPDVSHNDGTLAASIARQAGIAYEAASSHLTHCVNALRAQLEQDGEFTINRVGTLRRTPDGTIDFVPAPDSIASLIYKGLCAVPLPAAPALEPQAAQTPKAVLPAPRPAADGVVYIPLSRRILKVAACFCLLAGIGFVCSTPVIDGLDQNTALASMPGGSPARTEAVQPDAQAPKAPVRFFVTKAPADGFEMADTASRQAYRASMARKAAPAAKPALPGLKSAQGAVEGLRLRPEEPFCIVVASLQSARRARAFIDQTGDAGLQILEQDGRFRVVAGSAPSEAQAKAIAWSKAVQARYPGAWVTEK